MSGLDVPTILRAIEIVGAASEAGLRLYEAFRAAASDVDQATIEREYAAAIAGSEKAHLDLQRALTDPSR